MRLVRAGKGSRLTGSLVPSRRPEQWVQAGSIWIQVIGIDGGRVKLRFVGPTDVKVMRGEIAGEPPPEHRGLRPLVAGGAQ